MEVQELLSRLENVRKGGMRNGVQNWSCKCPAHEDKGPSLSVGSTADGRILLRCFAGCEVEAIAGAIGVDLQELFPPKVADDQRKPRPKSTVSSRDVARQLEGPMIQAFLLLRKAERMPLTDVERAEAGRLALLCPRLIRELAHG